MNLKNLIKEEATFLLEDTQKILSITDLIDLVSRLGVDKESISSYFRNVFLKWGDDGIIRAFKEATDLIIEPVSKGKYMIKYS